MQDIYNFLEEIKKHISLGEVKHILECGSCDLQHAVEFSKIFPDATMHTFECDPVNVKTCRSKLEEEKRPNLRLYEVALTNYVGEVDFYSLDEDKSVSENAGIGSIYRVNPEYRNYEAFVQKSPEKVPCTTVKKWAEENSVPFLDLLWLDAQGSELHILKGCGDMLSRVKAIQVESELKNLYLDQPLHPDINQFLIDAGFEYIKNNGISKGGWFMESVYVNKKFKKIDLSKFEKKIFSQNGEDGITATILNAIGVKHKTYFEIGVEVGAECNSRFLWQLNGFSGVMFDGKYPSNPSINLVNAFVTKDNVISLLKEHNVPKEVDVFSIDTDLNDFYFMKEILKDYSPRLIILEYNSVYGPAEDKVTIYAENDFWTGDNYQHATLLSWYKLMSMYNYSLVYCEETGTNCFWVRNDCIPQGVEFLNTNNLEALYKKRDWDSPDKKNREFITFEEAMNEVSNLE